MNNLKAPLAVFATGTVLAIIGGELGAIVLVAVVALIGYGINKAAN
jgi:hypothetical protein